MEVKIGHSSISERGTVNGVKGDSTGKEVCIRSWYNGATKRSSSAWSFMAIHPDANVREKHAKAVEDACLNNNIGYGQYDRNTANTEAVKVKYNISKIKNKCNCDCSSLQNLAAVASGANGASYGSNGWTTRTMKKELSKLGYLIIEDSKYTGSDKYCVRGAIYVKPGSHTICGLDNGKEYMKTLSVVGVSTPTNDQSTKELSLEDISMKMIKRGSRGRVVMVWQSIIGADPDGKFGPDTKAKTIALQKKAFPNQPNEWDGIVGDKTWKAGLTSLK